MKKMVAAYKGLMEEIGDEVKEGLLAESDSIQVVRADQALMQGYRPILDWYYDAYAMEEELETPLEQMFMEDEFSPEEWAEMRRDHEAYKKQYETEKDKLEEITVKAALTEMKQMVKLFG